MSEPKTVWKGDKYEEEPIRGQASSLFWSSDSEQAYYAYAVKIYHCGKCFINLPEGDRWPKKCAKGHLNYLRGMGP